MGHASHFLTRLNRLDAGQEQLALALYRDPRLVRAVLAVAKVPEGARRIAFALSQEPSPPHLLVERDGAFVTCLGPGMAVHDAELISHLRFNELRQNVVSLREIFDRAEAVTAALPQPRLLLERLMEGGAAVTREEMQAAIAVAPLWHLELLKIVNTLLDALKSQRAGLLARKWPERWTRTPHGAEELRLLWQRTWCVSHLALLVPFSDPLRTLDAGVLEAYVNACFFDAMLSGFLPGAMRWLWALSRMGVAGMDAVAKHSDLSTLSAVAAAFAHAALGEREPALRGRARAFLARPLEGSADSEWSRGECESVAAAFESLDKADAALLDTGRAVLWSSARKQKLVPWSSAAHIPEAMARALMAQLELTLFEEGGHGARMLTNSIAWLARAEPEALYVPASPGGGRDFELSDGLRLLKGARFFHHRPEPVRVEREPGRNEPCPCGSGKKFKKCCAK